MARYGPHENSIFRIGHLLNRKTSQTGWVFDHQTHIIRRDLVKGVRFPADKHTIDEGYRSLCSVPLIVRGNGIGVVTILNERKNAFSMKWAYIFLFPCGECSRPLAFVTLAEAGQDYAKVAGERVNLRCERCKWEGSRLVSDSHWQQHVDWRFETR